MKKITLLLAAFIGLTALQSCTIEEYYDENYVDGYSQVFELTNETISTQEDAYTYSATWNFTTPIFDSDNVLVYRWQGNSWTLVPVSYNLGGNDMVKYDYDFTRFDVKVYFSANFPVNELSNAEYNEFVYRQTFRVVVVPGGFAQKINYNDYNATISALGLENAPIKTLKLKK
ncbi:hypothetical protein MG290_03240 [Flavobacterium sp. CBA20B-1]|uniref:hypothetical protein n=1 Tax=unclassified Flavobacterium TaxID=196869 RepID=UPI0022241E31|nr:MULTISPECIES: hypothetical protein [unclassified Flavobacterium]WCM42708.1 hypothetical protein MG290_03240 [Flavobacterium sp. CBA20B-1]